MKLLVYTVLFTYHKSTYNFYINKFLYKLFFIYILFLINRIRNLVRNLSFLLQTFGECW